MCKNFLYAWTLYINASIYMQYLYICTYIYIYIYELCAICGQDFNLHGNQQCSICPADIHNYPYTDVSENPCWMPHCFTDDRFRMEFPALCIIFLVKGVLCHALSCDTMHNKHLGVDQYFGASVLWLLVFYKLTGIGYINSWPELSTFI